MERLTHKARYEAGYKLNKGIKEWQAVDRLAEGVQESEQTLEKLSAYICDELCCHRNVGTDKGDYEMQEICERCELGGYLDEIRKCLSCENNTEITRSSRDSVGWMTLPEPYRPESNEIVRDENEEGGLSTFQLLHDVEKEMSKEERKQVMIENAINLKTMCDYVVSCSYLDIVLIICMLRDYVQMVDEIRTDDIQWSVYYRNKFLKMADKFSEQIEYDYDAAKERCLKRQQKEENAGDIGEDAMTLAVKYGKGKKKKEKESGDEK